MAKPATVAGAVVGVADLVGLAGITAGDQPAGREPSGRPAESDALARRDADRLGIRGESSRRVGGGGTHELARPGSQPASGLADGSVPSGKPFGFWFWTKTQRLAHTERPW